MATQDWSFHETKDCKIAIEPFYAYQFLSHTCRLCGLSPTWSLFTSGTFFTPSFQITSKIIRCTDKPSCRRISNHRCVDLTFPRWDPASRRDWYVLVGPSDSYPRLHVSRPKVRREVCFFKFIPESWLFRHLHYPAVLSANARHQFPVGKTPCQESGTITDSTNIKSVYMMMAWVAQSPGTIVHRWKVPMDIPGGNELTIVKS